MIPETSKKVLSDVDGVLVNWEDAFTSWMAKQNYTVKQEKVYNQYTRYGITKTESDKLVTQFNDSAWIGWLRPLRDATEYVPKLANLNCHIECITSLSSDLYAGKLRKHNVKNLFGNVIQHTRCIGQGADKDDILKEYEPGHWWIEDKPQNCDAGLNAGHKVILINHDYNMWYDNPDVIRVNNWKEIIDIIGGEA